MRSLLELRAGVLELRTLHWPDPIRLVDRLRRPGQAVLWGGRPNRDWQIGSTADRLRQRRLRMELDRRRVLEGQVAGLGRFGITAQEFADRMRPIVEAYGRTFAELAESAHRAAAAFAKAHPYLVDEHGARFVVQDEVHVWTREDFERFSERLAELQRRRPPRGLVWLHRPEPPASSDDR